MINRAFGRNGMSCFSGVSDTGVHTDIILSKPNKLGEIAILARRSFGEAIRYSKHDAANRVAAMRYVAASYGLPF